MKLLKKVFELDRWNDLMEKAIDKKIDLLTLKQLCVPAQRADLYQAIVNGNYQIHPAHIARIPKDKPGEFREVHINEPVDRCMLSLINDCLFELFPHYVHPTCTSYQKGKGSRQTVTDISKELVRLQELPTDAIGVKIDLMKYFDNVNRESILAIFDRMEEEIGPDPIFAILRDYYHMDLLFNVDNDLVEQYGGLKQGCAVASFLANALLYDIDEKLSTMKGITYRRYSDDLLILGENYREGQAILMEMLKKYGLSVNPKKVEILYKDTWFKFLGFNMKGDLISLSKSRLKRFQKEIEKRTIGTKTATEKQAKERVIRFLYEGDRSWATSCLGVINCKEDIHEMNLFVMDCLRAVKVREMKGKKGKISIAAVGGLGVVTNLSNKTILRGKGKNVRRNRNLTEKEIENYLTISCLQNAYKINKEVFMTCVKSM